MVVSGSMEPTIKTGSVVFTKQVPPSMVKKGDIIAFTSPSNPKDTILHRVIAIKSEKPLLFSTKGDNNNTPDAWDVMDVGVKGVYFGSIPYLGHAAAFIRKPLGFSLVIVIPALLFIIAQLLNIKKAISEEIEKGISKKLKEKDIVSKVIIFTLIINAIVALCFRQTILALYTDKVTIGGISVSIKDFVPPPIPRQISPTSETIRNTAGMVMDWEDVVDYQNMNNPVYYIYQSSRYPDFHTLAYTSAKLSNSRIPAPGTPQGIYYWHVRACDAINNCSDWSSAWKLIVDNSAPVSSLNPISPLFQNTLPLTIGYTASDNIDYVQLCYSYQSQSWTCPNNSAFKSSTGDFTFLAPDGDGLYLFESIAHDLAGNTEIKSLDVPVNPLASSYVMASIDTHSPTTTINTDSLNANKWQGQNLLNNGDFHDSLNSWSIGGDGQHLVTDVDAKKALLLKPNQHLDTVWQVISIPQNSLSQLSFSFRYFSSDFAPNNQFQAQIRAADDSPDSPVILQNVLSFGNTSLSPSYDSGWLSVLTPLYDFAGQTIKVWFGISQSDTDPSKSNWVYLNNVRLSPVEVRVGDTNPVDFIASDLASGPLITPSPSPLDVGGNQLDYSSVDNALNVEQSHNPGIIVTAPVVLDKIDFVTGKVHLFNNSSSDQLIENYYLQNSLGSTQTLPSVSVGITTAIQFDLTLSLSPTDKLSLFSDSALLDSTEFGVFSGSWYRIPRGLGTWVHSDPALSLSIVRHHVNKITLTLANIFPEFGVDPTDKLQYEILYQSSGEIKGIVGQIFKENIIEGKTDRDFFLGTCSSGNCTNDPIDVGSTIISTLTGKISGTNIIPIIVSTP